MAEPHAASRSGLPGTTHLLYLHGFRSSPQSFKAQRLAAWLARHRPAVHWWCPQLPPSPREALALVASGTADWPSASAAVVGSSLGGFYAAALAQQRGWRAVVINPAVNPARDLASFIGEQTAYHDPQLRFEFRREHVEQLRALQGTPPRDRERLLAIIAKGDELLDWREMAQFHAGASLRLVDGSDHALSDFDAHLDALVQFLRLA